MYFLFIPDDSANRKFPPAMKHLFYLLADYNFKNGQMQQGADYYMVDVTFNRNRYAFM